MLLHTRQAACARGIVHALAAELAKQVRGHRHAVVHAARVRIGREDGAHVADVVVAAQLQQAQQALLVQPTPTPLRLHAQRRRGTRVACEIVILEGREGNPLKY